MEWHHPSGSVVLLQSFPIDESRLDWLSGRAVGNGPGVWRMRKRPPVPMRSPEMVPIGLQPPLPDDVGFREVRNGVPLSGIVERIKVA